MKLRIHADSIRLRLKQAEVRALSEGKPVVETCPTVPVPLTYVLQPDAGVRELQSHSDGSTLTLRIPMGWLSGWERDERVGFDGRESGIQLIVEKDFKCLHPGDPADNADCFEKPEG